LGKKTIVNSFSHQKIEEKKNPEIYGPTNDFCLQENKNKRSTVYNFMSI
jgi:hypothetical protein